VTSEGVAHERRSAAPVIAPVRPRKLAKVPFVERVYVSSITSGDHGLSCNTNNNRPCGGLGGGTYACNHLRALADAAVAQYGLDRVARYLKVTLPDDSDDLWSGLRTTTAPNRAAEVFSGFLRHLAYLEVPPTSDPLPELHWFPAAGAVR
jgi:hypothetical protein